MNTNVFKVANTKYTITHDHKNCIYSSDGVFCDFHIIKDKFYIRKFSGGIDLYIITTKQYRRLRGFLKQGYSVSVMLEYRSIKNNKFNKVYKRNGK